MEGNVEHAPAELEGLVRVRRSTSRWKRFEKWVKHYKKVHGHFPDQKTKDRWMIKNGWSMNGRDPNPFRPPTRH